MGECIYTLTDPSKSNGLSYRGDLYFRLPYEWTLQMSGTVSYNHRDNYYRYISDLPEDINRDTKENAWRWSLRPTVRKQFDACHSVFLDMAVTEYTSRMHYTGSTDSRISSAQPTFGLLAGYNLNKGRISFDFRGGGKWLWSRIDGRNYSEFTPTVWSMFTYQLSSRNHITVQAAYSSQSPGIGMKNPVIIQEDELIYVRGTPDLKALHNLDLLAQYGWYPSNVFRIYGTVTYKRTFNQYMPEYLQYDGGHALLRTYANKGQYEALRLHLNYSWSLIEGKLSIFGGIDEELQCLRGGEKISKNVFLCSIGAQGYIDRFTWSVYYNTPSRGIIPDQGNLLKGKTDYGIWIGWSLDDLNVGVEVRNFFRSSWINNNTTYQSPHYSVVSDNYGIQSHARIAVSLTWTIGYGKKIQRGDEVKAMKETESALIN